MQDQGKIRIRAIVLVALLSFNIIFASVTTYHWNTVNTEAAQTLSRLGSSGSEVRAIQEKLKEYGLYGGNVDGIYGEQTRQAVITFQRQRGLTADGIAGTQTLSALGVSVVDASTAATQNVDLLARIISAEARGEPYTGQIAVGACVLNRVQHPSFPDTVAGVIYQPGAFTAIVDGQINQPVADSAYNAAREALSGSDPSGGAIYYYNPDKTSNQWMLSRPVITTIGNHVFCS